MISIDPWEVSDQFVEQNFENQPLGPASRSICKVTDRNTCGSGSIVGVRNGKSLVLSNAHVTGTRIGKQVLCEFPELRNRRVNARIIMSAYSDRTLMDWSVLECDEQLPLTAYKLNIQPPSGQHYTGGYPRCRGPFYQRLETRSFTHRGTVWRWQPPSVGGQSGSGVHSFADHSLFGLLTWLWGGDGAGQTARSIWFQYINRAALDIPRPEGLVELSRNRSEDCEPGFFKQTNITTLPIWKHLDDDDDDQPDGGDEPSPPSSFVRQVREKARTMHDEATSLLELARRYEGIADEDNDDDTSAPLFGL